MKLSVKMHPAGWIFFALMLAFTPAALVVATLAALLLHEGGHLLVMALCGAKECTVEITPFGGMADVSGYETLPPWKKVVCALAGPALSLLGAVPLFMGWIQDGFFRCFFVCNLSMALINLLPVFPLDGARILVAASEKLGLERLVCRITQGAAYLFALFLFVLGITGVFHGRVNLSLFLLPPYLCYTAYQSALYTRIRGVGYRLFLQDEKRGEIRPLKAFVSFGRPGKLAIMRHLQNVGKNTSAILYICDADTGTVTEILTTKQICHNLISE